MSLWNVELENLTFQQLDEFLSIKEPENARLDYKAQCPDDIENIICAFANTLGGLIVIGVNEKDRINNEPDWPPTKDLEHLQSPTKGLIERIQSKANTAVYPPVAVEISSIVNNTYVQGKILIVVKVHQSRQSPHAVSQRRQALVYERTKNQAEPYRLADIDQIQAMLKRRSNIEDRRHEFIRFEKGMAEKVIISDFPIRWVCLQPYFPDQQVLSIRQAYDVLNANQIGTGGGRTQRVHDGAYRTFIDSANDYRITGLAKLTTYGQFYYTVESHEVKNLREREPEYYDMTKSNYKYYDITKLIVDLSECIKLMRNAITKYTLNVNNYISVVFGIHNTKNIRIQIMNLNAVSNSVYPYSEYRRSYEYSMRELCDDPATMLTSIVRDMYDELDFNVEYSENVAVATRKLF